MSKQRCIQPFRKKFAYDFHDEHPVEKPNPFQTPSKYNTIDSKHTEVDISNAIFSIQSSRIAEETSQVSPKHAHYEDFLRQKMEQFEAETSKIIEKQDRDIYFLSVQIQNYEVQLNESELLCQKQKEEILQLRSDIQTLITQNNQINENNKFLQETLNKMGIENSKLKESLQLLITEKNQSWKIASKKEYASVQTSHHLKREIEDLRIMVAEMEHSIKNCQSCFSLRRQNEELAEAYNHLKMIYGQLTQEKAKHEKDLLQNITTKIQENQNIIRQNIQLKEKRRGSALKEGRQRLKQSVAKRCRTLTDQF